jgi:hypothetical protein
MTSAADRSWRYESAPRKKADLSQHLKPLGADDQPAGIGESDHFCMIGEKRRSRRP